MQKDFQIDLQSPDNVPVILVVDDSPDQLRQCCENLAHRGFQCLAAASVAEAKNLLQKNSNIALIVLDWVLDHSGSKVIQTARELYPQIPILVVSGDVTDPRPDVFSEAVDAFLQKPFQSITLFNQVKQLLKRSQFAPSRLYPQRIEEVLQLDDLKSRYAQHVLQLADNNLSAAAEKLGVHRQTLSSTLKKARQEEVLEIPTTDITTERIEASLKY